MNSITIYMVQEFIDFGHTARALFGGLVRLAPGAWHMTGFRMVYVLTCWLFLLILYRFRLSIKV